MDIISERGTNDREGIVRLIEKVQARHWLREREPGWAGPTGMVEVTEALAASPYVNGKALLSYDNRWESIQNSEREDAMRERQIEHFARPFSRSVVSAGSDRTGYAEFFGRSFYSKSGRWYVVDGAAFEGIRCAVPCEWASIRGVPLPRALRPPSP